MKQIIKIFILVFFIILPSIASAYIYIGGIFYEINGDYAIVSQRDYYNEPNYKGNIVIPETMTYNGKTYPVIGIGTSAFRGTAITSVEIPPTVTYIYDSAFAGCHQLSKVLVPNSITYIGKDAFQECYNLKSIVIPSSVSYIGPEAFGSTPFTDIYSYRTSPIICGDNYRFFSDYTGTLHVPATSLALYFITADWCNFENIIGDAIEPTSLDINNNSINLYIGDQFQLSATITPLNSTTNDIIWKSTNGNIAIVEDGLVYAIGLGECDIVAYCYGIKSVCHVSVIERSYIISLDQQEAMVLPNHIITLNPSASPVEPEGYTVISSDPTVAAARVMNGKVQVVGIKEGTATITVGSADGTAVPATCLVTVYTEPGDVNMDGFLDVSDVTALISHVLGGHVENFKAENADLNGDGVYDVVDVTSLIALVLNNNG